MDMEYRTGAGLAELLITRLGASQLEDVYIDEDEDGRYLGLVFSDGEIEYHLTLEADGTIQLAEGAVEGESLEEVVTFALKEVEPPFSTDGIDSE